MFNNKRSAQPAEGRQRRGAFANLTCEEELQWLLRRGHHRGGQQRRGGVEGAGPRRGVGHLHLLCGRISTCRHAEISHYGRCKAISVCLKASEKPSDFVHRAGLRETTWYTHCIRGEDSFSFFTREALHPGRPVRQGLPHGPHVRTKPGPALPSYPSRIEAGLILHPQVLNIQHDIYTA